MTRKKDNPHNSTGKSLKKGHKQKIIDDNCSLLADAVLQSRDAITVQDLNGRITAWNKGAEKMYGYSESEALNMNISAIIPEERLQEIKDIVDKIRTGGEVRSLQTIRRTRDGRVIHVWFTLTKLVDKNDNITGFATIERDVTEHSKLLEEIESTFALAEEYTHDIERLVAERTASLIALNIADRVINPAVVISMICKRMLAKNNLANEERANLEVIREETGKLQQIVHEFASLVEKKPSLFSYDDMNGIIKEALVLIQKEAEEKGIELISSLSETPLMINMDRHVLRTAIFYIYKNALEATQRGGSITTSTEENTDSISIVISDTGCGISDEHVSHVFDNFFTTKIKALGMGLPFV